MDTFTIFALAIVAIATLAIIWLTTRLHAQSAEAETTINVSLKGFWIRLTSKR